MVHGVKVLARGLETSVLSLAFKWGGREPTPKSFPLAFKTSKCDTLTHMCACTQILKNVIKIKFKNVETGEMSWWVR